MIRIRPTMMESIQNMSNPEMGKHHAGKPEDDKDENMINEFNKGTSMGKHHQSYLQI